MEYPQIWLHLVVNFHSSASMKDTSPSCPKLFLLTIMKRHSAQHISADEQWLLKRKPILHLLINIFQSNKMKSKKFELDVDFIGGEGPLTPEEEKALRAFIKQPKEKRLRNEQKLQSKNVSAPKKSRPAKRSKKIARH